MIEQVSKPVVVPDLNYLQKRPVGNEHLCAKYFWLWPMRLFHEIADRGDRAYGDMDKLFRIHRLNERRIAIAAHPQTLFEIETNPNLSITGKSLIDVRMTQIVGMAVESNDSRQFVDTLRDTNHFLNTGHNLFWSLLKLSKDTTKPLLSKNKFYCDIEKDKEFITPELAWDNFRTVAHLLNPEISAEFPSFATLDPSNSHMIALAKCMLYLRLRWDQKELTEKELNDYDDCQYAIYSALTGHIATDDKGLIRMIKVCFPETTFISDEHSVAKAG